MPQTPASVEEYLAALAPDRRTALQAVRQVIRDNLDDACEEGLQYGAIGYYIPHRVYPAGYHCDPQQPLPFASLGSRKQYMVLMLGAVYGDSELVKWFREAWTKSGRKLDMGAACIRFKRLEDVPLDIVAEAVRRVPPRKFLEVYQQFRATRKPVKRAEIKRAVRERNAAKQQHVRAGEKSPDK